MKHTLSSQLVAFLASKKFFVGLLIFFVFESLWIACTARYPMAFDEDFHFGVIKLYAGNHFSPFFGAQPDNASTFGAVARDPSYLYHYIMSFPYRLVAAVTDSQTAQVIALRCINVLLVTGGLVAFRAVMLRAKLSRALAACVTTVFILVPIVPLLAGQINYDNILILTVPLTLLLVLNILDGLRLKKVYVGSSLLLASALLLESLVKYPFLPIAIGIVAFLVYQAFRNFRSGGNTFWRAFCASYRTMSHKVFALLAVLFVVSFSLFFQRYGINLIRYHAPLPDCAAVLSVEECQHNGPWARDQALSAQKVTVDHNPLRYANLWFHDMLLRSFFAINGPFSDYANDFPLWLPVTVTEFLFLASVLLVLIFARKIFAGNTALQLFALIAVVYVGILAANNYASYLRTGEPVAINGRYLLLILPLALAIAGVAFVQLFHRLSGSYLKPFLAVGVILVLLQGGGFVTYILQSDTSWYWQGSHAPESMNTTARQVLRPLVFKKSASWLLKYE